MPSYRIVPCRAVPGAVIGGIDGAERSGQRARRPYVKSTSATRTKRASMKKLFSKIDNTSKEPNSYLGKVFVVGRHTVTVEEVLAEGTQADSLFLSLSLTDHHHYHLTASHFPRSRSCAPVSASSATCASADPSYYSILFYMAHATCNRPPRLWPSRFFLSSRPREYQ